MHRAVIYITASYSDNIDDITAFDKKIYPLLKCAQKNNLYIEKLFIENSAKPSHNIKPYLTFDKLIEYLSIHNEIEIILINRQEDLVYDYLKVLQIFNLGKSIRRVYDEHFSALLFFPKNKTMLKMPDINPDVSILLQNDWKSRIISI